MCLRTQNPFSMGFRTKGESDNWVITRAAFQTCPHPPPIQPQLSCFTLGEGEGKKNNKFELAGATDNWWRVVQPHAASCKRGCPHDGSQYGVEERAIQNPERRTNSGAVSDGLVLFVGQKRESASHAEPMREPGCLQKQCL